MITILLPTRKRVMALEKSLRSLIDNAKENPFIIFGVDDDDPDTLQFLQKFEYKNKMTIKFNPLGYTNLYKYINAMCNYVKTDWLMFWNDDAIMNTKHYDTIIESEKKFKLQRVKEQTGHPYSIFPILPHDWFKCLDRLSAQTHNDAWLSEIAYMLNIMKDIDVEVTHDRADITGNNNDETFKFRKYNEGNPDDPNDLHHKDMVQKRFADAEKLAWFLERIGQSSVHWKKITKKEIKPFANLEKKFLEYQKTGAIGAGKQNAKTPDQGKIKVSYKDIP